MIISQTPRKSQSRFEEKFASLDPIAKDLLRKLLSMDPDRRITADGALDHEYFWSDPAPATPDQLPKYPPSHEFTAKKRRLAGQQQQNTNQQNQQQQQASHAPMVPPQQQQHHHPPHQQSINHFAPPPQYPVHHFPPHPAARAGGHYPPPGMPAAKRARPDGMSGNGQGGGFFNTAAPNGGPPRGPHGGHYGGQSHQYGAPPYGSGQKAHPHGSAGYPGGGWPR